MWKKLGPVALLAALLIAALIWRLSGRGDHAPAAGDSRASAGPAVHGPKPPAAPASLSGHVTSKAGGRAIAGAIVALTPGGLDLSEGRRDERPLLATTDATGAWTIADVPPGTYVAAATAAGFIAASRDRIAVAPAEHRTGVDLALEPGGTVVRGIVTDVGGGAIGGARITALSDSGLDMLFTHTEFVAMTGNDGRYEMALRDGAYRVLASHDDYTGESKQIELAGKAVVADFMLTPGATIRGQVIARDTGKPVPGAHVHGSRRGSDAEGTSDSDGNFALRRLHPGAIALTATGRGYASSSPTTVEVGIGEQVEGVRVVVDHAYTISGKVVRRGDAKHGIPGVLIGAFSMAGEQVMQALEPSDADGAFEIVGARPGSLMLFALGEHVVPEIGKSVAIVDRDVTGVIVEMSAGVKLSGRVDPPGIASIGLRPGVEIGIGNLFDAVKAALVHADSDPSGAFVLDNVPDGKLVIVASTREGPAGQLAITVASADQTGLVVPLETRGSIAGHVVDTNHAPVAGMHVGARAVDRPMTMMMIGTERPRVTTDDTGAFKLVGLEAGKYTVHASEGEFDFEDLVGPDGKDSKDRPRKPVEVELAKAEARTGVVITVDARDGVIRGQVIGSDGRPAADAWVTAYRAPPAGVSVKGADIFEDYGGTTPVLTGDNGKFAIERLRKGSYKVVAEGARGAARADQSGVKPGDSITLTLQPLGTLSGHLTARGAPVATYSINCRGPAGEIDRQITAPDGGYALEHLAPGSYACETIADTGTAHGKVDVPPGSATLDLSLVPWAGLTGTVVSALTGQPVPGVAAIASAPGSTDDEVVQVLTGNAPITDASGRFELAKVAEGTGQLLVMAKQGSMMPLAEQDYTATAGQRVDLGKIKVIPPRTTEAGTLGMVTSADDKGLAVTSVASGGPAAQAGIVEGDRISSIDGRVVADLTPTLAGKLLASGTIGIGVTVTLGLERGQTVSVTSVKW